MATPQEPEAAPTNDAPTLATSPQPAEPAMPREDRILAFMERIEALVQTMVTRLDRFENRFEHLEKDLLGAVEYLEHDLLGVGNPPASRPASRPVSRPARRTRRARPRQPA